MTKLDPEKHRWLQDAAPQKLWQVTSAAGAELRLVGGAVRNALLNAPVHELDFAINVPPETTEKILQQAKIKTVRTGFEHGTITAVIDGRGFEITSLRADIQTDGRHATVTYTDDWAVDAARRDFTFNALYADAHGKIFDYGTGIDDLQTGTVRFIGDPSARIAEDYLRILRFFRFHAWYGKGAMDAAALKACADAATQLTTLSAERVWQEIKKILSARDPTAALMAMNVMNLWQQFLPEVKDMTRLARLVALQKQYSAEDILLRLFVLLPDDEKVILDLAARLRFSREEKEQLLNIQRRPSFDPQDSKQLRRLHYRHGGKILVRWLMLKAVDADVNINAALHQTNQWQPPVFPITGDDVLAAGVAAGPVIGQMLRAVEDWWLAEDFKPDRAACLAKLRALVRQN
jgi:poly(A) polymerase